MTSVPGTAVSSFRFQVSGRREGGVSFFGFHLKPETCNLKPLLLLAVLLALPGMAGSADSVRGWLLKFAGGPSRYLGSPGHVATLQEAERHLRACGVKDLKREKIVVTVPWEKEAWISGPGLGRARVHMVWPNHVQLAATSKEGIRGVLVDAGHGEAAALDGGPVTGAIALVRLPCRGGPQGWVTPFVLGAPAVAFLPPRGGKFTRADAEELFLDVPADLPRFWAAPAAAGPLLAAAKRRTKVTLVSRAEWRDIDSTTHETELKFQATKEGEWELEVLRECDRKEGYDEYLIFTVS